MGRWVLACRRWGIDDAEAFALLAGASPASTTSSVGLARIASACDAAGAQPSSLDAIRAAGPDANQALDDYLADHAWRAFTQYSPKGRTLIELPQVLVRAVAATHRADSRTSMAPDPAALRSRVPQSERDSFDDLLADARRCYGIRDDNVALTFLWPSGLVRRALLEIGRRLDRGRWMNPSSCSPWASRAGAALDGDTGRLPGGAPARADGGGGTAGRPPGSALTTARPRIRHSSLPPWPSSSGP